MLRRSEPALLRKVGVELLASPETPWS